MRRLADITLSELPYSIQSYCFNIGKKKLISILDSIQRRYYAERLLSRSDLIERARCSDTYWEYASGENVSIETKPDHPAAFKTISGKYYQDNYFIVRMDDSVINTKFGIVFTPQDEIILESIGGTSYLLNYCVYKEIFDKNISNAVRLYSVRPQQPTFKLTDPLLSLCGVFSSNYYHWILQHLPKLRALRYYHGEIGDAPKILIEPNPPKWQLDAIDVFAPSYERIEWDGRPIGAPSLIPVHHLTSPDAFEPSMSDLRWLQSHAHDSINLDITEPTERIYISRDDADSRRVRNEDELMEMLQKYGFVRILLSEYSFPEQVALFANADTAIGPHGAAFANLIFAGEISVLELMQSDNVRSYFYALSELFGFEYDWIECERYRDDIVVDVAQVEHRLNLMM